MNPNNEQQIKSRQRVADHGEVFTADREVNAMLDLVNNEKSLSAIVSSLCPYGLPTNYRGKENPYNGALTLHSSEGES